MGYNWNYTPVTRPLCSEVSGLGFYCDELAVVERFGAAYGDAVTGLQRAAHGDVIAAGLTDFHCDTLDLGVIVNAHDKRAVFPQYHGVARHGQCDIG